MSQKQTNPSQHPPGPRPRVAVQPASPAFRHPNVTTRSPRSSPNFGRSDTFPAEALYYGGAPTASAPASRAGSMVSSASRTPTRGSSSSISGSSSPMFFHASEVKPSRPMLKQQSSRPPPPTSSSKFFYADTRPVMPRSKSPGPRTLERTPLTNGLDLGTLTAPPNVAPIGPSVKSLVSPTESSKGHVKFLYANGDRQSSRSPSPQRSLSSGTTAKSSPRILQPSIGASPSNSSENLFLQAQSTTTTTPTVTTPVTLQPAIPLKMAPRTTSAQSHSRRASVSIDTSSAPLPRRASRAGSISAYPFPDILQKGPSSPGSLPMQSNAAMMIEQQQQLALAARRERKYLDQEIAFASLLAINKTLEKRMRKQTAELRRFRRLSRSGRLSLAPAKKSVSSTGASDRSTGEEFEDEGEDDEEEEEEEDVSEEEDEEPSDEEEDDPSIPQSEQLILRRQKDEKRLASDLAKHQALLDASGKMNASLKRCQFVAETLIEEGKKSLAYVVFASEVKLGGRVVENEEEDDGVEHTDAKIEDGYEEESGMSEKSVMKDANGYEIGGNGTDTEDSTSTFNDNDASSVEPSEYDHSDLYPSESEAEGYVHSEIGGISGGSDLDGASEYGESEWNNEDDRDLEDDEDEDYEVSPPLTPMLGPMPGKVVPFVKALPHTLSPHTLSPPIGGPGFESPERW